MTLYLVKKRVNIYRNAGGAPANVAIAAARNGLEAGMCCKVGDDDFGRFLVDTLKKEHVKVISDNLCEEAITTMAFVSLAENGERTFTFARKPGADMFLRTTDVKEKDIDDSTIIHAGSCSYLQSRLQARHERQCSTDIIRRKS